MGAPIDVSGIINYVVMDLLLFAKTVKSARSCLAHCSMSEPNILNFKNHQRTKISDFFLNIFLLAIFLWMK